MGDLYWRGRELKPPQGPIGVPWLTAECVSSVYSTAARQRVVYQRSPLTVRAQDMMLMLSPPRFIFTTIYERADYRVVKLATQTTGERGRERATTKPR